MLPLNRVKAISRLNESVGKISSEANKALATATELFARNLVANALLKHSPRPQSKEEGRNGQREAKKKRYKRNRGNEDSGALYSRGFMSEGSALTDTQVIETILNDETYDFLEDVVQEHRSGIVKNNSSVRKGKGKKRKYSTTPRNACAYGARTQKRKSEAIDADVAQVLNLEGTLHGGDGFGIENVNNDGVKMHSDRISNGPTSEMMYNFEVDDDYDDIDLQ